MGRFAKLTLSRYVYAGAHVRTLVMQPTLALAERIAGTGFAQIPAAATTVAKQALLDVVGVTVAGANEPLAAILRDQALDEGGHAQASLIGRPERVSVPQAALINGAAGHAHDYDDVHTAMTGHPTVPVAPALLALAEHHGKSGRAVVAALCAGVDTECILGLYAGRGHYQQGWHATGTLGSFAAAAASANLLGLDVLATASAMGIAGTQAAGLKSQFGTMCKPLHAGHAAATGVQAAMLASKGFDSRLDILETPQGFMATQAPGADEERFRAALAKDAYCQDICFKYHAACYLTHSSMEALNNLCATNTFAPDDIDTVHIRVDPGHFTVCNIAEPASGLEAKFSLRFTAAMVLAGEDTASIESFTDELTQEPRLVALRDRVTVVAHEKPSADSVVTITTKNGESFCDAVNVAIPMRNLDAQWDKLTRKFHALTDPQLGRGQAEALAAQIRDLENQEDLTGLFALLRSGQ